MLGWWWDTELDMLIYRIKLLYGLQLCISLLASFTPSIFLKVCFLLLLFNIIIHIFFNKLQDIYCSVPKCLLGVNFYGVLTSYSKYFMFFFCLDFVFIYVVCFFLLCMLYLFWRHPAKPIEGIIMFWTPKNLNFTTTNKQPTANHNKFFFNEKLQHKIQGRKIVRKIVLLVK